MSSISDALPAAAAAVAAAVSDSVDAPLFNPIGSVADSIGEEASDGATTMSGMVAGDVMTVKSLCVGCEDEGETKILLTKIPFFRDVILMAFECEHCGLRNSEVQSAEISEKGCRFEVVVTNEQVWD